MGVALLAQMATAHGSAANVGVGTEESKEPLSEGKPTCIICLGMAGSGKTTFVQVNEHILLQSLLYTCTRACLHMLSFSTQRITAHLHARKTPPYVINLDPAVHEVPFPANIGWSGT